MFVFKNEQHKYLLGSLFREVAPDTRYVIFSLHDDIEGLINARRTFVELEDPTGHDWAKRYLGGSYEHWTKLIECRWFRQAYDEWMLELNARIKARSLKEIRALSESPDAPDPVRLAALKYLHGGESPTKRRVGRPTTDEVQGEIRRQVRESKDVQDDMERIGLKVI